MCLEGYFNFSLQSLFGRLEFSGSMSIIYGRARIKQCKWKGKDGHRSTPYTLLPWELLCTGRSLENVVDFSFEMLEAIYFPNVSIVTTLNDIFSNDKGVKEAENSIKRLR